MNNIIKPCQENLKELIEKGGKVISLVTRDISSYSDFIKGRIGEENYKAICKILERTNITHFFAESNIIIICLVKNTDIAPTNNPLDIVSINKSHISDYAKSLSDYMKRNITSEHLYIYSDNVKEIELFAYYILFNNYSFTRKTSEGQKYFIKDIYVNRIQNDKINELNLIAQATFITGAFANDAPNYLNPETYANRIKETFAGIDGVNVKILSYDEMKKLNMGGVCAVGQGSAILPKSVVIEWKGDNKSEKYDHALIGKGVTFDAGGISLKPAMNMDDMKFDMAGSAAVIGAMFALTKNQVKKNVVAMVGLAENMPSGSAVKPSDIITMMSGNTVEVLNTDAEGRLILADLLHYVQDKYNVKKIVDIATLTGAIIVSLGDQYAGLFSNNKSLAGSLIEAGIMSNEMLWPLPLSNHYSKHVKSHISDYKNISDKYKGAGSITAAEFLKFFIKEGVEWAHIDMAGVGCKGKISSRFGVQLLYNFIKNAS